MDENSRISVDPYRSTSSVIQKGDESIVMHENPATKANFLSKLFFWYIFNIKKEKIKSNLI